MPKKKTKQTFETIRGLMIVNHRDKTFEMSFGVNVEVLDLPEIIEKHLGACFYELIEKINQQTKSIAK